MIEHGVRDAELRRWLPLVRAMARHLGARLPGNIDLDDLVQVGSMGLLDAISRYDSTQPAQFETFARHRIRGAMLDELRRQDWLPRKQRQKIKRFEQAEQRLQHHLLRLPSDTDLADELGLSLAQVQQLRLEAFQGVMLSLDTGLPRSDATDQDTQIVESERMRWQEPDPADAFALQEVLHTITRRIGLLPARQRRIFDLYYGDGLTLAEIAHMEALSPSRIGQMIQRINQWLRMGLEPGALQPDEAIS